MSSIAQAHKSDRISCRVSPKLKRDITSYAQRHSTSVTAILTEHFCRLLEEEKLEQTAPEVDQI